jgi:hypothetical protein
MLMVIGLTLALVAVLAIAPVLNDEMAYASNSPRGGAGGTGGSASASSTAACKAPQTCSAGTFPFGGGFVACGPPGFIGTCAGSVATGNAGGNGASGGSGPSGAGGNGGGGGSASTLAVGGGAIGFANAPGGAGGAGGARGGP